MSLRIWALRLSLFSGLEVLSRILQMACALLVIRFMAKEEYAWYSMAIGFQGMVGLISMVGAGAALYSIAGPLLPDRQAVGGVLHEVKKWRGTLFFAALPFVIPFYGLLLHRNGCPWPILLTLLVLAAGMILLEIQRHLLAAPLEMALQFNIIQRIEVLAGSVRLILLLGLIALGWMGAIPVLLVATLLVGWIPLLLLPRHTHRVADPNSRSAPPDTAPQIRRLAFHAAPGTASYILEAQFAGFFVAFSGYTAGVADIGALTRLGLFLTIPAALLAKIIQPKLATITDPEALHRAYRKTLLFGALVAAGMISGIFLIGPWLLLLLGPNYANLQSHLLLYSAFLALSFFTTANASVIEARGWLRRSWMRPLVVLSGMAIAAFFLPVQTVPGAIALMMVGSLGNLAVDLVMVILGFRGRSNV